MKVEYICHACLLIETADALIVTDPWFEGAVYCDQWHVFPKPVHIDRLKSADCILVSHGHEDHLQQLSFQQVNPQAKVFYPFNWYGSIKPYMAHMGFTQVQEAVTYRTYRLGPQTTVTYVANNLDSIIVIESAGQVMIDVNDALHAHHPNVIELFCDALKKRWPKIDAVFCGFGGASYFPNSIHVPGKDDREVGKLREQVFIHNFCRIVSALQPKVAVPFAADFALLDPEKLWMNDIRIPREQMPAYFAEHFPEAAKHTTVHCMYPGDVLDGTELDCRSPYREQLRSGSLNHLISEQYAEKLEQKRQANYIDESSAEKLRTELQANVEQRMPLISAETLSKLRLCVHVTDVATASCYNVNFVAEHATVDRDEEPDPAAAVVIDVSSRILRHGFASIWGGDAITIGYGAEIHIQDPATVEQKLDSACVRLLTRHPVASRYVRQHPLRAARFLYHNPLTRQWALKRLSSRSHLNAIYDQDLWLRRTKCEVCQVCDMPLLDADFAEQLV